MMSEKLAQAEKDVSWVHLETIDPLALTDRCFFRGRNFCFSHVFFSSCCWCSLLRRWLRDVSCFPYSSSLCVVSSSAGSSHWPSDSQRFIWAVAPVNQPRKSLSFRTHAQLETRNARKDAVHSLAFNASLGLEQTTGVFQSVIIFTSAQNCTWNPCVRGNIFFNRVAKLIALCIAFLFVARDWKANRLQHPRNVHMRTSLEIYCGEFKI